MTAGILKRLLNNVLDDVVIKYVNTTDDEVYSLGYTHSVEVDDFGLILDTDSEGNIIASLVAVGEDTSINTKTAIIDEVSKFLQHNGFTDASKAVDCHWEL
jgi:hypothetical protein